MEHLVRLAHSSSLFYAAVFVFTGGLILWLAWARFFHERDGIKRTSYFVMAIAIQMLLVGGYASIVAKGLDGVVCASGRYSTHLVCYRHDENPLLFWFFVALYVSLFVLFMLVALAVMVGLVVAPGDEVAAVGTRQRRRPTDAGGRKPAVDRMKRGTGRLFLGSAWLIAASTLAWIAATLHQTRDVQKQVAWALASVGPEKAAVEAYLQGHGTLPEDNQAAKLSSPADLRRQYVSAVEIAKGSLLLKFDATTADRHLGGRFVMLIAVRHEGQVSWHCASPDIDDRYLPDDC